MPYVSKRVKLLILLPAATVFVGTVGFMAIEKFSFINALYFTIVTISTVGYGDVYPESIAGKLFGMVIIVVGIGGFLSIVTTLTQSLVASGEDKLHKRRIRMLMGLYFTEAGNGLLRIMVRYDLEIDSFRKDILVIDRWGAPEFSKLKATVIKKERFLDPKLFDLGSLLEYLGEKGGFLSRLLENPDLTENESFSDLLWATVHLRDELMARTSLTSIPYSDLNHFAKDATRVYNLLIEQWLDYMENLQHKYPYLFSFAVRMNPFSEHPSATISGV